MLNLLKLFGPFSYDEVVARSIEDNIPPLLLKRNVHNHSVYLHQTFYLEVL